MQLDVTNGAPFAPAVRQIDHGITAVMNHAALQNLNEHVQAHRLLRADQIAETFAAEGLAPEISRFDGGIEAIIAARRV
jgi:hypothetical protein